VEDKINSLIIYFSQSGGTKQTAAKIQEGITSTEITCDLLELQNVTKEHFNKYDCIGIGCPTFYYQEPWNIIEFLENIPDQQEKLWFVFCSHGTQMGVTLQSMGRRLKSRDAKVIGYHHSFSDGTLPFYPCPSLTYKHPDKADLEKSYQFGVDIAGRISNAVAGKDIGKIQAPPIPQEEKWVLKELHIYNPEAMATFLPVLNIDTETCIRCGTCVKECPVDGIDIACSPIRIQNPCIFCYHCAKVCPTGAIKSDYSTATSLTQSTILRCKKSVDAYQSRGEFTYHLDPATVDYDNTLWLQQENKRAASGKRKKPSIFTKLMRITITSLGLRDFLFTMAGLKASMLGKIKKRNDIKEFY